jgi:hypothetical protein
MIFLFHENTTHEEFLAERKKRLGENYVNNSLETNKKDSCKEESCKEESSDDDIIFSKNTKQKKFPNIICSSDSE